MLLNFLVTLENLVDDRVQETEDRGATAVEYGLMVALIAVAITTAVTAFGTSVSELFGRIGNVLDAAAV